MSCCSSGCVFPAPLPSSPCRNRSCRPRAQNGIRRAFSASFRKPKRTWNRSMRGVPSFLARCPDRLPCQPRQDRYGRRNLHAQRRPPGTRCRARHRARRHRDQEPRIEGNGRGDRARPPSGCSRPTRATSRQRSSRSSTPAMIDRLTLTPKAIAAMADGLRQIAALPDPIGEITEAEEAALGHQGRPGCACRSAWSPSSTSPAPTSPPTRRACA